MTTSALLIGSLGVLCETSDLQRRAYNTAFEMNELDWHWDQETYRGLLKEPCGRSRIVSYAASRGQEGEVDAAAVHADKMLACEAGAANGLQLRPGIAELIAEARRQGTKLGLVTGSQPRQIALVLDALQPGLDPSVFDYIGNKARAARPKPAPDLYNDALRSLRVEASNALAIEDRPEGAAAAVAAGIATLGYPGALHQGRDFGPDIRVVDRLCLDVLRQHAAA